MNWFRIFYKKYGDTPLDKACATIEFQAKKISNVLLKAEKMGKKKKYRVVMIAEIAKPSGMPNKI